MQFEDTKRTPRSFKVKHSDPGDFHLGYILLPIGYAYNAEWNNAKKGDILRFWDGGDYPIFAIRKLKLNKPDADILCRMRYGITIKRAIQIWQSNAKMEGHGAKAVSTEECLWIIYGKDTV